MEGSKGEAIFDSFNLNPQLFINEVLNAVDDMVDGAFEFYEQDASKLLTRTEADRSDELKKGMLDSFTLEGAVLRERGGKRRQRGVAYKQYGYPEPEYWVQGVSSIRRMIQAVLNKRLGMWEKYCLRHCFTVPEGFSLARPSHDETPMDQYVPSDSELDAQLDSLREKLSVVGNESVELQRELQALEKQSIVHNSYTGSVNEALQLFEQNSTYETSQEIIRIASELRTRMAKLKIKRREEIDHIRVERLYNPNRDQTLMHSKGLSDAELEYLQELAGDMKNL